MAYMGVKHGVNLVPRELRMTLIITHNLFMINVFPQNIVDIYKIEKPIIPTRKATHQATTQDDHVEEE